jgi:PAS domain S-box-containing protein
VAEDAYQEIKAAIQRANTLVGEAELESHVKSVMLSVIPSILIGIDEYECVTEWNPAAQRAFGIAAGDVIGKPFAESGILWDWSRVLVCLQEHKVSATSKALEDMRFVRADGIERVLGITLTPVLDGMGRWAGCLLLAADITERRMLESQLAHAQKMESIGQLAAGIAHEINTPIQYIGDNTRFLLASFAELQKLLVSYSSLLEVSRSANVSPELIDCIEASIESADLDYMMQEIPRAISQSLEGIERVAHIVQAMKEFSHPGMAEKTAIDINRAIGSTIAVARNEWKYVAKMVTNFDPLLPMVPCLPGDFNQVILNMIVNAAHAIESVVGKEAASQGTITVSTRRDGEWAEIKIQDTGAGIPAAIRNKVFDPFFTTKEVGKGTGQGLAIAHSIIVKKHAGAILLESEEGVGTTFIIRLPLATPVHGATAA